MNKITMILRNKFILGIIIFLFTARLASAQQDPMFTQYMFNTQTINPAYVGTWQTMGFMALSRLQWVGLEGAPSTQTFSFQTPLNNKKIGLGLNIVSDKIGLEKKIGIFADYSYLLRLSPSSHLRFGLKGGFSNYSHNLSEHILYPDGLFDPAFQGAIEHRFLPNVGVGAFLDNTRYYLGLSIPKIVNSKYRNNDNIVSISGEIRSFYFIAGYIKEITDGVIFKPTLLTKATIGSPVQVDLSANFLLQQRIWLGAMYRTDNSFGFIAQWIYNKKLRIGYAIDFSTSNLKNYHYSTHEIMLSYELRIVKQRIVSPRYF